MHQEFFTWPVLATYAGAVLLTTLVTQFVKQFRFLQRIPTQVISYLIALIGLLGGNYFTTGLTLESALLCCINAVVVATAANGTFNNLTDIRG